MRPANNRYFVVGLITAAILFCCLPSAFATTLTNLQCDYRENPLGIDAEKPRLSWIMVDSGSESATRSQKQTSYQILVASSEELLKQNKSDCWDSGQVASDQSIQVEYQGKPLVSRMRCYWKVRVWDKSGKASAWSEPALWTMGLLQPADWTAKWITASRWYMPPNLRPPGLVISVGGWADVDLGEPFPIDSIRLYFSNPNAVPKRFKILGADDLQFSHAQVLVDQSAADYQAIGSGPQVFAVNGAKFRRIRLWFTNPSAQENAMMRQCRPGQARRPPKSRCGRWK